MNARRSFPFLGPRTSKIFTAIELLIFLLIILVWVFVETPKSIIPLFIFSWVSLRLRGVDWQALGLRKPDHLTRSITIALALGSLLQLTGLFFIQPILSHYLGITDVDPRDMSSLIGSIPLFFLVLLGQWVLAGFGEEAVFRGYLLNRITDLVGDKLPG